MSETKLAIVTDSPMVLEAMASLDGMRQFAEVILKSGIAPHHLYEKGADNKPDFTKGKTEALMAIFIKADQLRMHPMTAMQEVVPVNGLLSIKGDGCKSLILKSGKIKTGSWREEITGTIEDGTYKVTITATRSDTEETMSRSFSVAQAKRAGLWITAEMLQKQDGWKKKQSAWYKFSDRMIRYRALGFIARDLWPDVLQGSYTLEEAMDMPQDQSIEVDTGAGTSVVIPDQQFTEERSEKLTSKAAAQIDAFNPKATDIDQSPPSTQEDDPPPFDPDPPKGEAELPSVFHLTEKAMQDVDSAELLKACMDVKETKEAVESIKMKNTNKKLRGIIVTYMNGRLPELVRKYGGDVEENKETGEEQPVQPTGQEEARGAVESKLSAETPPAEESIMEPADGQESNEEIEPNKGFDTPVPESEEAQQDTPPAEDGAIPADTNKFNIDIPELPEDGRPFDVLKDFYYELESTAGLNNEAFAEMNGRLLGGKYKSKEEFCRHAPVEEVNLLLNSIE